MMRKELTKFETNVIHKCNYNNQKGKTRWGKCINFKVNWFKNNERMDKVNKFYVFPSRKFKFILNTKRELNYL